MLPILVLTSSPVETERNARPVTGFSDLLLALAIIGVIVAGASVSAFMDFCFWNLNALYNQITSEELMDGLHDCKHICSDRDYRHLLKYLYQGKLIDIKISSGHCRKAGRERALDY
ncbi:MAG: hypothetical protein HC910_17150 [Spirulinaceae cyanobacterium SM2_1_0]|nr:hypothetical protein [Spirulinaceae cyanobacterium SM2_1_0]